MASGMAEGREQQARGGGAAAAAPRPVDATRVLNLFGYVGPVASLMTHTLLAHGAAAHGDARGGRGSAHIQRLPGVGGGAAGGGDGRLQARPDGAPAGGKTRFVLSHTEDAMDSVLPCAAERMFKRPGKFGNPSNLRFSYH